MAIVKATYTRSREGAKASVRYIQQRPGRDREKITRTLFGRDGAMGRLEAYSLIDGAEDKSFFYRFALSPDPAKEDTGRDLNMQDLTYKTMQTLDKQLQTTLLWVAALHEEHAPHRHVHIIVAIPRKLSVKELARLTRAATRASLKQRRKLDQSADRQVFGQEPHIRQHILPRETLKDDRTHGLYWQTKHSPRQGRPVQMHSCSCPRCGAQHVEYGRFRVHQCTCGLVLHRQKERSLQRKGVGLERQRQI